MDESLQYTPLDEGIASDLDKVTNLDELILLPLGVGMNHPDWKYSQDLCLKLTDHSDWRVRANAFRGLEYTAMTKGKLEKHLVKPILLKALRSDDYERLDIIHITERINNLLNWKIGTNRIEYLKGNT